MLGLVGINALFLLLLQFELLLSASGRSFRPLSRLDFPFFFLLGLVLSLILCPLSFDLGDASLALSLCLKLNLFLGRLDRELTVSLLLLFLLLLFLEDLLELLDRAPMLVC